MRNYDYQKALEAVWKKAVDLYASGKRGAESYFDESETEFLKSIGITAQEVYDYAEDYVSSKTPDFATFIIVHDIRRWYFLEKQKGIPSGKQIDPASLPPKNAEVRGIAWLPRIIVKAKAKLRGELHPDIMYGCAGDRGFLRRCDIHLGEFLRMVAEHEDDDDAIIDWVVARCKSE